MPGKAGANENREERTENCRGQEKTDWFHCHKNRFGIKASFQAKKIFPRSSIDAH